MGDLSRRELKNAIIREYIGAKMQFLKVCDECYTHDKFVRLSDERKDIPKICKNCPDRLRLVLAANVLMRFNKRKI